MGFVPGGMSNVCRGLFSVKGKRAGQDGRGRTSGQVTAKYSDLEWTLAEMEKMGEEG